MKAVDEQTINAAAQYLSLSRGGVNTGQASGMQKAAVMQTHADEVSGAVGWSTDEHPTAGQKVVDLEVERLHRIIQVKENNLSQT